MTARSFLSFYYLYLQEIKGIGNEKGNYVKDNSITVKEKLSIPTGILLLNII